MQKHTQQDTDTDSRQIPYCCPSTHVTRTSVSTDFDYKSDLCICEWCANIQQMELCLHNDSNSTMFVFKLSAYFNLSGAYFSLSPQINSTELNVQPCMLLYSAFSQSSCHTLSQHCAIILNPPNNPPPPNPHKPVCLKELVWAFITPGW